MISDLTKSRPYRTHLLEPLLRDISRDFSQNIENIAAVLTNNANRKQANATNNTIWTMQLSPKSSRAIVKSLVQISFTDINTTSLYWNDRNVNGADSGDASSATQTQLAIFKNLQIFLLDFPEKLLQASPETLNNCLYKYSMVDILIGCVETTAPDNTSTIFQLIGNFLKFSPNFISRLANYKETVNLILEFINQVVYFTTGFIDLKETVVLNEAIGFGW